MLFSYSDKLHGEQTLELLLFLPLTSIKLRDQKGLYFAGAISR
jgi:hypothetical protein